MLVGGGLPRALEPGDVVAELPHRTQQARVGAVHFQPLSQQALRRRGLSCMLSAVMYMLAQTPGLHLSRQTTQPCGMLRWCISASGQEKVITDAAGDMAIGDSCRNNPARGRTAVHTAECP